MDYETCSSVVDSSQVRFLGRIEKFCQEDLLFGDIRYSLHSRQHDSLVHVRLRVSHVQAAADGEIGEGLVYFAFIRALIGDTSYDVYL